MKVVSLFSGIGGLEVGFGANGIHPILFCEVDPVARAILGRHFPGVPIENDVQDLRALPQCDVVSAGFPCQDLSQAGTKRGITGKRSSLVEHLFKLLRKQGRRRRPEFLVVENVPYMLRLAQGHAMNYLTMELAQLGYRWAYRVVDARSFGLPQRRPRVVVVAARDSDPRDVLFADSYPEPDLDGKPSEIDDDVTYGFYWTEGSRGVGWTREGVPPIKCGSTVGIASPPAVWRPRCDFVGTIDIEDAERLQGFPVGWTDFSSCDGLPGHRSSLRWRLIGNAVSTRLSEWVGRRLSLPGRADCPVRVLERDQPWPQAAFGSGTERLAAEVSRWAGRTRQEGLTRFLSRPLKPLSAKATGGFLRRAGTCTNVVYSPRFLASLERHRREVARGGARGEERPCD